MFRSPGTGLSDSRYVLWGISPPPVASRITKHPYSELHVDKQTFFTQSIKQFPPIHKPKSYSIYTHIKKNVGTDKFLNRVEKNRAKISHSGGGRNISAMLGPSVLHAIH